MIIRMRRDTTARLLVIFGIGIQILYITTTVSAIVIRETASRKRANVMAITITNKKSRETARPTENVTTTDNERHKRILPYLEYYSESKPIQHLLAVAPSNERVPDIQYILPVKADSHPNEGQNILLHLSKYNHHHDSFVTIPKKSEFTGPPNYSEIYDKLSRIKMLQINSLESPSYSPKVKMITPRPYITQKYFGNIGKGPPSNPHHRPSKTYVYVQTPLKNEQFYPSIVNSKEEEYPQRPLYNNHNEYELYKGTALSHNNNQFFYEHPVVLQIKPQDQFVPIVPDYNEQSFYDPRNLFAPPSNDNNKHNKDHTFVYEEITSPQNQGYKNNYDRAEETRKLHPVFDYGNKIHKLKQKTNVIQPVTEPKQVVNEQEQNSQINTLDTVPTKLVEIISENTMKYYKNIPTAIPNLSEEIAKKTKVEKGPTYKDQSLKNHKVTSTNVDLDIDQNNDNSLNHLLKRLQETNTLPKTFTVHNIDNSIKTLVHILSSLKKQKKLLQPVVVSNGNEQYDELGNEADGPITIENYPSNHPEGGTPGAPGIDYPALSEIPPTSFDCKTQRYKGFFADPETNCQVWHYCDLNGGQASFLCPNGTIFSQVALTCDWWYNVKCASTPQLYVLNERLYKYIIPLTPKFPEDYSGPLVDRYLAMKFQEMEEKMKEKKGKKPSDDKKKKEDEKLNENDKEKKEHDLINPAIVTLSEVNE